MQATGDQHTRRHGDDHGDSDDIRNADSLSDALTTTTMDEDIANGEWEDWDENYEDTVFVCLFCPETFSSRSETLQHCSVSHGFNYTNIKKEWDLDIYSSVRLLNFIRQQVKDNERADNWDAPSFSQVKADHKLIFDDKYLQPVLEDDALLYEMDDDDSDDFSDDGIDRKAVSTEELLRQLDLAEKRAHIAEQKVAQLESVVGEYQTLITRLVSEKEKAQQESTALVPTTTTSTATSKDESTPASKDVGETEVEDAGISNGYFSSYAHFGIHMSMLKDAVRTDSYRDAIYLNKDLFKDKIVLDIGCGTGILSMFAARSGAKKVIGIDRSDIVHKAQKIVKKNQLDGIVTIIRGEVEKVTLPVDKVDIIVSEWMGYFLIYESMLDTVLFARDKWLQPNGVVQPSKVELLLEAASIEDYFNDNISWWHNVYGFDMECMREGVLREAQVDIIHAEDIISSTANLRTFDILRTKKEDQEFYTPFALEIKRAGDVHAFVGYFDTHFEWSSESKSTKVFFSTGSHATPTHWKQTVFLLEEPIPDLAVGDVIKGSMTIRRDSKYFRALDMWIEWAVEKGGVQVGIKKSQSFHLG
jgi:protein arginine N-methyltransferase 3